MASHLFEVGNSAGNERRLHDIAGVGAITCGNWLKRNDLLSGLHQSLSEQKTGSKFEVVTRSAHGDAERFIAHSNFQRLFRGKIVVFSAKQAVVPFGNLREIQLMEFRCHTNVSVKAAPSRRADSQAYIREAAGLGCNKENGSNRRGAARATEVCEEGPRKLCSVRSRSGRHMLHAPFFGWMKVR